jgi:DNA-directed RNA polymerase subunit M/transcription elongation factor TFIIS
MYLIIRCPSCNQFIMANNKNKTRKCAHCGNTIELFGTRIIARTKSSRDAVKMIQALKESKQGPKAKNTFKKFT